jgi:preprotein translocase subunit SecD
MGLRWSAVIGVVTALALAGCGGDSQEPPAEETAATCEEAPAGAAATVRYAIEGETSDATAEEVAAVVCARLDALGVPAQVEASAGELSVTVNEEDAAVELAKRIATPARLAIYDWEGSLADDRKFGSEADAELAAGNDGLVVFEPDDKAFYVIGGEPAMTGADIESAEQTFDQENAPAVAFEFTDEGATKFEDLTRAVAQSGGSFAIVVDDEVLTRPIVDPAANPDGIDGEDGAQIAGAFTIDEARELAAFLDADPLPEGVELTPIAPES